MKDARKSFHLSQTAQRNAWLKTLWWISVNALLCELFEGKIQSPRFFRNFNNMFGIAHSVIIGAWNDKKNSRNCTNILSKTMISIMYTKDNESLNVWGLNYRCQNRQKRKKHDQAFPRNAMVFNNRKLSPKTLNHQALTKKS